ncbi:proteasome assembly chaperone family protein [Rothia sp. P13129]|uniref:proteasome assembly chaperone family protein n=1 Tax=unclassified Rothia (in: high G+C Gram-positive bacteria) TaxID=2689056 RepID=UPI003AD3284E
MSTAKNFPHNIYSLSEADQQPCTVMLCAFEGWNDAGSAATEVIDYLMRVFPAEPIAGFNTESFYSFTESRPRLESSADGTGKIIWPELRCVALQVRENLQLLVVSGPEPNVQWRSFATALLQYAQQLSVDHLLFLGSLLEEIPHTRPFPVSVSSYTSKLRAFEGVQVQSYSGPTGIVGVLALMAESYPMTDVSCWVSIPHYAGLPPHPKATFALLQTVESILDIQVPHGRILQEVQAWEDGAEALLEEDPELAAYVRELESQSENLVQFSGEDIAAELEQYLRRREE